MPNQPKREIYLKGAVMKKYFLIEEKGFIYEKEFENIEKVLDDIECFMFDVVPSSYFEDQKSDIVLLCSDTSILNGCAYNSMATALSRNRLFGKVAVLKEFYNEEEGGTDLDGFSEGEAEDLKKELSYIAVVS